MLRHSKKLFISIKKYFGRKFRRYTTIVNRKIFRPSSEPFISGDTFRKKSDFIFDEVRSFDPDSIKEGNIIFLKTDLRNIFFDTIHPKIKNKYVLITHNSDENISKKDTELIDEKIIHWFAQNLSTPENDKVSILPIGFENRHYLNNGKIKNLKNIQKLNTPKVNKILASFNKNTNYLMRNDLLEALPKYKNVDIRLFGTPKEYLINLKKYKFIICPEGNGVDTHRVWEGLLAKTVPIMLNSVFAQNLKSNDVPIILLNNWDELADLNLRKIEEAYKLFEDRNFNDFTNIFYWLEKVNKKTLK